MSAPAKPGDVVTDWYDVINSNGHLSEVMPSMYFTRRDIERCKVVRVQIKIEEVVQPAKR